MLGFTGAAKTTAGKASNTMEKNMVVDFLRIFKNTQLTLVFKHHR